MTHTTQSVVDAAHRPRPTLAKCVIWDLDNTLWDGTLLEGDALRLRSEVVATIEALDARGILNSVASRNEYDSAYEMLSRLEVVQLFVAPQISWGPKSEAVRQISVDLNLGIDSLIFIDDDPFERAEVASALPQVRCFDARESGALLQLLQAEDLEITEESRNRRAMYQADGARRQAEASFAGTGTDFLRSLSMEMIITQATAADLERAQELTARTSQLNSSGHSYSLAELDAFRRSSDHQLLMVSLIDRFGSYGRIGLALLETRREEWTLKLLLTSCRVMSRGIGGAVLAHLLERARRESVNFVAEFTRTERNRVMFVMYRFAGFRTAHEEGDRLLLKHDLTTIPHVPDYISLLTG